MADAKLRPNSSHSVPEPEQSLFSLLLGNLWASLRENKRMVVLVASIVVVFLIAGSTTVIISQQPAFCANCHEIQPAYDQWRTSSHYGVACVNCHTEPGIPGYIKINVAGAQHLITHLTSSYQVPTEADVNDSSCLNCHPRSSLPDQIPSTTLIIDHSKHQNQQCSDCHGRLVHVNGADTISTSPNPHEVRDCTVCHTPENLNPHGYATLACTSCHSGIIPMHEKARLQGVMPMESCQECHQKNKVGSPEYCQTCHVSPHGISVPCSRCHTSKTTWTEHTFNHPVALTGKHAGVDCVKCHANRDLSSMKYVCSDCHTPPSTHPGTINGVTGNCANCHTPDGWKVTMPTQLVSASHNGRTNCLACHTSLTQPALPKDHTGRTNDTCLVCHKIAPAAPPTATPAPGTSNPPPTSSSGGPKALPGDHAGRTTCLACHANGVGPALPVDHAGRTDAVCTGCHKASGAATATPAASTTTAATSATPTTAGAGAAPASTKVSIPSPAATSGGPKPLPADHAGRTTCLACHANGTGPALPADHAGRQDAMCMACHKPQ
ncbi:MAG: NapC/NirT family cytochrome c [Chloroflexi bacterium]|nr:NapC/NirT family cytochrome c [Chloroflexota bacterium]